VNEILRTVRLDLVPATVALVSAELASFDQFGALLGAEIPDGWPPGHYDREAMAFFRDRLLEDPGAVGWYGWYALLRAVGKRGRTLVGTGGYLGPPDADGALELGYSIVPSCRGQGYGTELVRALVGHGFADPRVRRIIAHTTSDNRGSITVLERAGFTCDGPCQGPCLIRYSVGRPPAIIR